jgi:hypothetical protein
MSDRAHGGSFTLDLGRVARIRPARQGKSAALLPLSVAIAVAIALLAAPAVAQRSGGEPPLEEQILEGKYRRGDYGFSLGWHDPRGVQFDDHASFALPVGVRVRLRFLRRLQLEADVSYYRRSNVPDIGFSGLVSPKFDGLMVGATAQLVLRRRGLVRPYLGGGPILVSLSDDFIVIRTNVPENVPERQALASWRETDVGFQLLAGFDFPLAHRAYPFVEYRHLFGKVGVNDIRIGGLSLDFINTPREELETPSGGTVPGDYDWSGPAILGGLKIRF